MSDENVTRVAEYYDRNTRAFYLDYWHEQDIHFGLFPPGTDTRDVDAGVKRMTRSLVDFERIAAGSLVVDAGCGVGGAALDVAAATGANVVGLTISPVQVEIASERAAAAGLGKRASFRAADCACELPFPDGSVDAVITIEAACHFVDKPRFLAECVRVLRPGGVLMGSDWMATDRAGVGERESLAAVCEAWRLASLESPSWWRVRMTAAGLDGIECEDLGDDVIANCAILARARYMLTIDEAAGGHDAERIALWRRQYDTLVAAWDAGAFTIATLRAVKPA